jgi:environmental stress-induced protein Ves
MSRFARFFLGHCYSAKVNRPTLIPKESYIRSLWKNGLGHTDQIAIEPAGSDLRTGNYLWRMSSAAITSASAFSLFPDHDRALIILSGAGVRLVHEVDGFEDENELPPLEPYEFPGDIASRCELLDGPVQDLSIFFRKGVVGASIEVVRFGEDTVWNWEPHASWDFIVAVQGAFEVAVAEESVETLAAGSAYRFDGGKGSDSSSFPVVAHAPGSVLIAIQLETF